MKKLRFAKTIEYDIMALRKKWKRGTSKMLRLDFKRNPSYMLPIDGLSFSNLSNFLKKKPHHNDWEQ
jgi:hypothetical protein